jgi:ATP-dependent 26S proteasome regulatory subunit
VRSNPKDVDLVAEERTMPGMGRNPLLSELLNAMEGMAEDADVSFLLTTDRPDILEPALAARPGRVDLDVQIDLPDAAGRRKLLELFGEGLDLRLDDVDALIEATEGVTPAFIKELLRKAAMVAAAEGTDQQLGGGGPGAPDGPGRRLPGRVPGRARAPAAQLEVEP